MSEYIKREEATDIAFMSPFFSDSLMEEIAAIPAADVVEVVRCRDCIHYFSGACLKIYSDGNVSQDAWQERNEDDFCSYGYRKEGADNG